ncbi:MAG: hypothetical protein KJP25_06485 [Gammaproteobacteria bacterium]|nr:hypothetical protein [Gammaproteobacteria bacterium]NND38338.1 hypothetical protein [Pseudomonadales bacterium]NNM12328.1 hypothetical protein [Pseudomonadales bacterium]RZV60164.1 MAG: hypothetical protein EX270_00390 [Pseudomonadales bacterium]
MIKKPDSKKKLREEIERQTREYLTEGQAVKQIPKGVSSRDAASGPFKSPFRRENWQGKSQPASERTYLTDVVDSLENRKRKKVKTPAPSARKKKPRKRLIYDDFGEPLRWVWVDD